MENSKDNIEEDNTPERNPLRAKCHRANDKGAIHISKTPIPIWKKKHACRCVRRVTDRNMKRTD